MIEKFDKEAFINEIIDNFRLALLEKIDKIPEDWDGNHIRQWAKLKFEENFSYSADGRKRFMKEINNTILTEGL